MKSRIEEELDDNGVVTYQIVGKGAFLLGLIDKLKLIVEHD